MLVILAAGNPEGGAEKLSPTRPLNAPVARRAAFDSVVPVRAWMWGSTLGNWPVLLFVALAYLPPLALVLPGPESERQLAPEVRWRWSWKPHRTTLAHAPQQLAGDRTSPRCEL